MVAGSGNEQTLRTLCCVSKIFHVVSLAAWGVLGTQRPRASKHLLLCWTSKEVPDNTGPGCCAFTVLVFMLRYRILPCGRSQSSSRIVNVAFAWWIWSSRPSGFLPRIKVRFWKVWANVEMDLKATESWNWFISEGKWLKMNFEIWAAWLLLTAVAGVSWELAWGEMEGAYSKESTQRLHDVKAGGRAGGWYQLTCHLESPPVFSQLCWYHPQFSILQDWKYRSLQSHDHAVV